MTNVIVTPETPHVEAAITPRLGDRPKRGIKNIRLKIINRDVQFRPHHQKTLLIDLLEFKQGEASVLEIVDLIEANPAYWARLNTVQSPYNCVVYHAKQLADAGFLSYEETASPGQVKERKGANKELEIVKYSKSKAVVAAEPQEKTEDVLAELGVKSEIQKVA